MNDTYTGLPAVDNAPFQVVDLRELVRSALLRADPSRLMDLTERWTPVGGSSAVYIPGSHYLHVLRSERYVLSTPILLATAESNAQVLVSDDEMHCWGSGDSFHDAIADYEENLIEAYEDLVNTKEPLARIAEDAFTAMRSHIARR